jgi:hypothetical protein
MKQLYKIDSPRAKEYMLLQLQALSLEPVKIVEVKPFQKLRTSDQNRLMWKSLLGDFASQAFVDGRLFGADVWHEHLKELFLPEHAEDGITKEGYQKWLEMPTGKLKMVGSTTKLTTRGMSDYLEQCYAFGCDLGVRFTAVPR